MKSVRLKLIALVLGSMVPALVAVAIQGIATRQRLLSQAGEVIDGAQDRLERVIDDSLKGRRAPLVIASHDPPLVDALQREDPTAAASYLSPLIEAYRHRVVVLSNAAGQIVAGGNRERGPLSLSASASPAFAALQRGEEISGLFAVNTAAGERYMLGAAAPIADASERQVGAIAVFSPVTDSYLAYLGRRIQAALSLHVDGRFVVATRGHAAPQLHADTATVSFEARKDRLWVVKSFKPKVLQREGQRIELTAAKDVTALRDASQGALLRELGVLLGITLIVLLVALYVARRLSRAVSGIAQAASEVREGRYTTAPVVKTGDELETLTHHFNNMVEGLKERDRFKETFGRYVTRQVAEHLLSSDQELGGELVPVTVLFSDIRSFTSISERMEPRALLDFLNEYFSGMVESVLQHDGVVDKFIGDAIMAVFGAPIPEPEDPVRAVRAALEMRARLVRINEDFRARGLPEVRTGIGLHSGQVVAGNMGHSERMEYTVIGDTVNLASRLEGMTKEFGCDVVISDDLYAQVKDHVVAEPLKEIQVKGRERKVMVYRLIGLRDEAKS